MSEPATSDVFLPTSGVSAGWRKDPYRSDALVLTVGDAEQSTLVPGSPTTLVYEYLQRVATVIDLVPAMRHHTRERPATVAHLGGGALSLPRRLEITHPGIEQVVVDLDRELMDFVLDSQPLSAPELTRIVIGDVQYALESVEARAPYAAVVLDIALEKDSPGRLLGADYMNALLALLHPDGALIINVGDEGGDPTHDLVQTLREAGASVFATGTADVLSGEYTGNVILVATHTAWDADTLARIKAAGPHPGDVRLGMDLAGS